MLDYLAGEGSFALLDADPGLMIWTFVTFSIVLFLLWKFAWGPIVGALDERAASIHADIEKAEKLKTDAEAHLNEYLQKLNTLKEEGQEIISEARDDAEKLKNDILKQAREEAEATKRRALREVDLAKDEALKQIHEQVVDIAIMAASQVTEKALQAADHKKFIEETISSVKGMN